MDWRGRNLEKETSYEAMTIFPSRGKVHGVLRLLLRRLSKRNIYILLLYIKISLNPANGSDYLRF